MTEQGSRRFYRTFGLTISSEIELIELEETAPGPADVALSLGTVDRPDPELPWGRLHDFGDRDTYLGFAKIGKYLIREAREVTYQHWPELPIDFAGYSFLGPVLATILHKRGYLILHGSALAVDGQAVVFLGDKGAGKSTTAGAMIAAGFELVTDDLIAVSFDAAGVATVQIGYPSIKVTPAALDAYRCGELSVLVEEIDGVLKRRARLNRPQPSAPVPIARIFLLERGEADVDPAIVPLPPAQALPAIFEHSYMARYGRDAFRTPEALATHFAHCAALVHDIGVATLRVPGCLERLPEAVAFVAANTRAWTAGQR